MTIEEFNKLRKAANTKIIRKKPGHEEDDLQQACVRWFEMEYPQHKMLLHHSPNGGFRTEATGARFKMMGTRAGFPDLVLLVPRSAWHGLFVEMKSRKGRQSEHQKEYEKLLTEQGYKYVLCRSLESFMNIIKDYMNG